MKCVSILSLFIFLAACATVPSGRITQTNSDRKAIALADSSKFQPGQQVDLLKRGCTTIERKHSSFQRCSDARVGKGSILEVRSANEILIQVDEGSTLEKGLIIQKVVQ